MSQYILNDPDSEFRPTYIPKFENPEQFVNAKLEMLRNHLKIEPTIEEIVHLYELKTEYEIIAAVKTILNNHWK